MRKKSGIFSQDITWPGRLRLSLPFFVGRKNYNHHPEETDGKKQVSPVFFSYFAITTINPLNLIKNNMILNVLQTKVENHKKFWQKAEI
ncbi:hypothetical protein ES703_32205 [subsurface metagenome]